MKYTQIANEKRQALVRMINVEGKRIVDAARELDIYYPTAKAINKVYLREGRFMRKKSRVKKGDQDDHRLLNVGLFDNLDAIKFTGQDYEARIDDGCEETNSILKETKENSPMENKLKPGDR